MLFRLIPILGIGVGLLLICLSKVSYDLLFANKFQPRAFFFLTINLLTQGLEVAKTHYEQMETDYLRFRRNSSDFTTIKVTLEDSTLFLDSSKQWVVLGERGTWRIDPIIRIKHTRYGGDMELLIKDSKPEAELVTVGYYTKAGDPLSLITLLDKLRKFLSESVLFDFRNWEEYKQSTYFELDKNKCIAEKYK